MALKFYMKKNAKDYFMSKALAQAKIALNKNEVPVGAIIVNKQGLILARAHNLIESKHCHTAHAETLAIQKACKKVNNWRLEECTLYVTLEPCLMCLGLIQLSRISAVVYGAASPLFGASAEQLAKGTRPTFAKKLTMEGGIKEKESVALLRLFFSDKRKKRKVSSEIEN